MATNEAGFQLAYQIMSRQKPDWWPRVGLGAGVTLLLALMAAELWLSAEHQSQTFDEACHIYAGYQYWKNSDFGVNPEHPPLVKLVAALPILALPLHVPPLPNKFFIAAEYEAGREFLYTNDANTMLRRARMAASALTLFLGLAIFLLANSTWGAGPAFLSLALFVFEPNFLAHGALVTTDIGVTLGLFLAVAGFYFYSRKPSVFRLVLAGLAAGLCLGTKHSAILVFPMLLFLAVAELLPIHVHGSATVKPFPDIAKKAFQQAARLAAITAIALAVLWALYGFRYAARPANLSVNPPLPQFAPQIMPKSAAIVLKIAQWHLLPEAYLYGVTEVLSPGVIPTYIFGKSYPSAKWYYFPAIFIVKSTVAFLIFCGLGMWGLTRWGKGFSREALFLIVPSSIYLAVAMTSGVNYGIRHLLPIYPFLIVLISFGAWKLGTQNRAFTGVVAALLVFHVASSVRAFPNYIPYSNEFWGGPASTHRFLADSNVDWGQGLRDLRQYVDRRHVQNCWLAYFGELFVDVNYYGVHCKSLPVAFTDLADSPTPIVPAQVDGPVFISSTELAGIYWRSEWVNPYSAFQRTPPSDMVADSIYVYDGKVDLSQASALTHEEHAVQLLREQKLEQALGEAQAAVEIAPNRPNSHGTRSLVLSAMGRTAEAGEELQKAQIEATGLHASE